MAAGPGYNDAEGIYQYGEDDTETLLSDLLNRGQQSVSQQLAVDRARLDDLESQVTTALVLPAGYSGNARVVSLGGVHTLSVTGLKKETAGNWGSSMVLLTVTPAPLYEMLGTAWASDVSYVTPPRVQSSGSVAFYSAGKPNTVTFNFSAVWVRSA